MLVSLDIRNILIIERLRLDLGAGLNVLSGETGAGKSILLDALGFVLGWRGRADLVRSGAKQGEVEAVFHLPSSHPALQSLREAGYSAENEIILRRVGNPDGRKTAWINDRRASGELLRQLASNLVELHGQHEDRGLLNPAAHGPFLDAFIDPSGEKRAKVSTAWQTWRQFCLAIEKNVKATEALKREEDYLRHALCELDQLAPETGEEAALDTQRRLMQAAEKIREDLNKAQRLLADQGIGALLPEAQNLLMRAAEKAEDKLNKAVDALARAETELDETANAITTFLDALEFDAHALENLEERLFAIRALARKHGVQPDMLTELSESLRAKLTQLDTAHTEQSDLENQAAQAKEIYLAQAKDLRAARQKGAKALEHAMKTELSSMKMERATFFVEITEAAPGPSGTDSILFKATTNPGASAGAINKIASGGELSRFMLALKVCLRSETDGLTMIFDEIDTGIGGATADSVGRRLQRLSTEGQVLVVTHLPQIAAKAQFHWVVKKTLTDGQTRTQTIALTTEQRIAEIARMLAGDVVSAEAHAAARALIDAAK